MRCRRLQSDNEKQIKIELISNDGENISRSGHNGSIKSADDKHMLRYVDEQGIKTSMLLCGDMVHIYRSGAGVNHNFEIRQNEKTVGIMGASPFSVDGRRCEWQYDGGSGEIRLCYTLPDISDSPLDFNIRIKFTVI